MIFRSVSCLIVCISIGLISALACGMEKSGEEQDKQELLTEGLELGLGQDKPLPRKVLFNKNRKPSLFMSWLIEGGYINEETLVGPEGQTSSYYALMLAEDPVQVLEFLLHNQFTTIDQADARGRQLIHHAAYYNLVDTVHFLRNQGADINASDGQGRTPLLYAAEGAAGDVIFNLSDSSFNLGATDNRGAGALHYSMLGFEEEFVLALYRYYSDRAYSNKDHMGRAPIHYAAWVGFEDIFDDLASSASKFGSLEGHRIDRDALDSQGNSFFHYAALSGNTNICNHPLGINSPLAHAANDDNKTPADIALENDYLVLSGELFREQLFVRNPEHIQHLLSRGLSISELQEMGEGEAPKNMLEVALEGGDFARVRELWSWGIMWQHREELEPAMRNAFSDLETSYSTLNNEGVPTWQLPLMFLPCFYDEAQVHEQILSLKNYVDKEKEENGSYIRSLLKEILLIAMAYGHLKEVLEILSYVLHYGLIEEDTFRALFLRSVLVSSQAATYSYSLLDPQRAQQTLEQGLRLAFGQRRLDSMQFFLLEQHVPVLDVLNYPYVLGTNDSQKQEEDLYTRMLALFQDYYSSYRTLLLTDLRCATVNEALRLPREIIALIMYWFMNGYFYNHT